MAFVYATAAIPGRRAVSLAVCSYALVAEAGWSFAAAATGGRSTAMAAVLHGRGNGPCRTLAGGIRRALMVGGGTPPG